MPPEAPQPRPTHLYTRRALAFARNRFSPSRYLGLHFTLGIAAIALALWAFIEIADAVHEQDDIARFDAFIATWLRAHATPALTAVMLALTTLGDPALSIAAALLLSVLFWTSGYRPRALFLAAAIPVGMLLNTALKHAFTRARPVHEDPLHTAHGYSFPSGHVAAATLLYTSLALILLRTARTPAARTMIVLAAAILILAVSFTRLYLGVHFLTDVLAAQAIALAWVALCATALDTLRRRALHLAAI